MACPPLRVSSPGEEPSADLSHERALEESPAPVLRPCSQPSCRRAASVATPLVPVKGWDHDRADWRSVPLCPLCHVLVRNGALELREFPGADGIAFFHRRADDASVAGATPPEERSRRGDRGTQQPTIDASAPEILRLVAAVEELGYSRTDATERVLRAKSELHAAGNGNDEERVIQRACAY